VGRLPALVPGRNSVSFRILAIFYDEYAISIPWLFQINTASANFSYWDLCHHIDPLKGQSRVTSMRRPDAPAIKSRAGINTYVNDDEYSTDIVARKPKKIGEEKCEVSINGHLQTNRVRKC